MSKNQIKSYKPIEKQKKDKGTQKANYLQECLHKQYPNVSIQIQFAIPGIVLPFKPFKSCFTITQDYKHFPLLILYENFRCNEVLISPINNTTLLTQLNSTIHLFFVQILQMMHVTSQLNNSSQLVPRDRRSTLLVSSLIIARTTCLFPFLLIDNSSSQSVSSLSQFSSSCSSTSIAEHA